MLPATLMDSKHIVILNEWGSQNLAEGGEIFQLPLQDFSPLVTNIGE